MRRHSPVDFTHVKLTGSFWSERLETVLTRSIPGQYDKLVESGTIESLCVLDPPPLRIPEDAHGVTTQWYWDSDIGKWIEAASYALNHRRDPEIEKKIDSLVDAFEKAQLPDGYLNCWYIGREIENRWTNLRDHHELYNAGHLLEGAIAYFRTTGRRKFLDVMERYIDHIARTFGSDPGQKHGYPGHQEIELALIKLYRLTGDRKRLDLAAYFINQRGQRPHYFDGEAEARGEDPQAFRHQTSENYQFCQAHKPVREQNKVVGHAVRAFYMYSAMADLAAERDDEGLKSACEVLWRDVTETRMYVTGGFGASAANEGFTADYDLPNDTAYCETCASVAMVLWAQRMLNLDLDGRYAEIMELALFNGVLSGLSRDGSFYFYENKLESDGSHRRWPWHPCPCCTMNVSRLVASIGGYAYSVGEDAIAVHLYAGSTADLELNGRHIRIEEDSDYPWRGSIRLTIHPEGQGTFALKLRIPEWEDNPVARLNGDLLDLSKGTERGYLVIKRDWNDGDTVELDLPMSPRRIYAHPDVVADRGRVALARGPLVYCIEQPDNVVDISSIVLPRNAKLQEASLPDIFGGITALTAEAHVASSVDWKSGLYRTRPPAASRMALTAIPYFLWANREPGPMRVWIPEGMQPE